MSFSLVIFYVFVSLAALSALGILFVKNVFKAALLLLLCLLSLAALYILSVAEFVAVTQILVYAGGVVVLIIFGIMLTSKLSGIPLQVTNTNIFAGTFTILSVLALLVSLFTSYYTMPAQPRMSNSENIPQIGINFMTRFSIPFEISGLLLLISLVGAAVITSFMKSRKA